MKPEKEKIFPKNLPIGSLIVQTALKGPKIWVGMIVKKTEERTFIKWNEGTLRDYHPHVYFQGNDFNFFEVHLP